MHILVHFIYEPISNRTRPKSVSEGTQSPLPSLFKDARKAPSEGTHSPNHNLMNSSQL